MVNVVSYSTWFRRTEKGQHGLIDIKEGPLFAVRKHLDG